MSYPDRSVSVNPLSGRRTISDEVLSVLRWRIITGELAPGDHVAEERLAREFGVSRVPVREAVRTLQNEGLVRIEPYRGALVADITLEELRDVILPLRSLLEKHVLADALGSIPPSHFYALESLVNEMEARIDRADGPDLLRALVELDMEFHSITVREYGGFHTQHLWDSIDARIKAGFYRLGSLHDDYREIVDEHRRLLESMRSLDVDVALRAVEDHALAEPFRLIEKISPQGG
ncbi:GntR family transcriptional regulator [Microbacterium immunditiarum]|uniref:DNA-binding GntR family transcriptional regulator n=1 Tax=Microbacterium immunditiarum TaxID=337480 RepID=A0A7Y9KJE9_9MICO|nr:GntR family transcriptional regulator [Microbacterium immunditiarum]NYE18068.1 DNA-binding GntR family transcriptional regulator [Microbacterium immunditiarum]